jgi:hypothetical protein
MAVGLGEGSSVTPVGEGTALGVRLKLEPVVEAVGLGVDSNSAVAPESAIIVALILLVAERVGVTPIRVSLLGGVAGIPEPSSVGVPMSGLELPVVGDWSCWVSQKASSSSASSKKIPVRIWRR